MFVGDVGTHKPITLMDRVFDRLRWKADAKVHDAKCASEEKDGFGLCPCFRKKAGAEDIQ
jgi:hypothetical protein